MKKKKLFKVLSSYLILISSLVILNSCNDDLTEELKSELSESSISTESDAIALVNGAYSGLLDGGWGYYGSAVMSRITDGITDVFDVGSPSHINLETYDWSDENIAAKPWKSIYKVVDRANWSIQLIEGLDESVFQNASKEVLIAEATFLRALAYFDLVGIFGGVPLKIEPTKTDVPGLPRTAVDEIYAQIESDFEFAAANLPGRLNTPGRASKGAAYGLLAKTQLRQLKWKEAGENIDKLIALGEYDLFTEDSFLKLFFESNILDNEFIFSVLSLGESYDVASNHHIKFFTPWFYDTGWATVGMPPGLYNSIEPDDKRGEVYFDIFPKYGDPNREDISALGRYGFAINRKFGTFNRDITAPGSSLSVAYKNYGVSKLGVPILRYADVLLLKAEIENELNGPNGMAYNAINMVRNRADLSNLTAGLSKEDFRTAVLHERAIELAAEGHRKDDLIRHNLFISTITKYLSDQGYPATIVTEDHKLMPIPRTELDLNPNMEPNPSNGF